MTSSTTATPTVRLKWWCNVCAALTTFPDAFTIFYDAPVKTIVQTTHSKTFAGSAALGFRRTKVNLTTRPFLREETRSNEANNVLITYLQNVCCMFLGILSFLTGILQWLWEVNVCLALCVTRSVNERVFSLCRSLPKYQLPYLKGPACTACDDTHFTCYNGLCSKIITCFLTLFRSIISKSYFLTRLFWR